jgi:hypothetical protein
MTTKLISSPDTVRIDPEEIRANPGALVEIHEDVLRDLMQTPHALQRRIAPMGYGGDGQGASHPRRRMCV